MTGCSGVKHVHTNTHTYKVTLKRQTCPTHPLACPTLSEIASRRTGKSTHHSPDSLSDSQIRGNEDQFAGQERELDRAPAPWG
ncbi:MAG UNVERIFIED_CONTAM: hypothetical protein LVR18_25430 [Planctomycetaceae bacterium]